VGGLLSNQPGPGGHFAVNKSNKTETYAFLGELVPAIQLLHNVKNADRTIPAKARTITRHIQIIQLFHILALTRHLTHLGTTIA
jgi:hypothetical protein